MKAGIMTDKRNDSNCLLKIMEMRIVCGYPPLFKNLEKRRIFMLNFFVFSTVDSWEQDAFQLTVPGIAAVAVLMVALIGLALLLQPKEIRSRRFTTKQLVFSAMAMALATVTSMIKLFEMPLGGSITLLSMLFIVLIGYWYGPKAGIITGFAYGLLQFLLDPVFYSVPQMIVDYPLAFGALGVSGFFFQRKHGLLIGYVVGIFARFLFAWLSGVLFFAAYADGSGMSAPIYSMAYNGSYIFTEGFFTLLLISLPPVAKALRQVKRMAVEG